MSAERVKNFKNLYKNFNVPITKINCGGKCSPYNEYRVPFCCDTRHAVPTAYMAEWAYLEAITNLWHLWESEVINDHISLLAITPIDQVLIECSGHENCQRSFRSITCRAFPFFPYFTVKGDFLGLSYYWQYEDRCWIISNLEYVSNEFLGEFIYTYDRIFEHFPRERVNFRHYSNVMRRIFGKHKRAITLLHKNGGIYKITPLNGRLRRAAPGSLQKYGPYRIAAKLPFPDEIVKYQ